MDTELRRERDAGEQLTMTFTSLPVIGGYAGYISFSDMVIKIGLVLGGAAISSLTA